MRFMNLSLAVALCLLNASAYAAPGDLLFQCSFDGAGATPQEVWHNCDPAKTNTVQANPAVSIINTGCVSGKCYKMNFTTTDGVYREDWFPMKFYPSGTVTNITIEFYEKFSKDSISFGNIKQARSIYTGDGSESPYFFAPISAHGVKYSNGQLWHTVGAIDSGRVYKISPRITSWNINGDGLHTNPDGSIESDTNLNVAFLQPYPGSSWKKYRWYFKNPSNNSTRDGEIWLWINDELILKVVDAGKTGMVDPDIDGLYWEPSIGAKESVAHYYDEIKVWEGFVAPDGSSPLLQPQKTPSSPTSLLIQ